MIRTKSKFYYGHTVDETSNIITFNEGAADITGTMRFGKYSLSSYGVEVARAMNAESSNSYVVTIDRDTAKLTISGTSNFSFSPVGAGDSAFPLMGFTTAKTGSNSYEGDTRSGSEYIPQFYLQSFVDFEDEKEYLQGTVKESASGIPEVVSFGLVRFMQCNITFINDFPHMVGSSIEENLSGKSDATDFMDYAISKGEMEFIPDRNNTNTFTKVFLETTGKSRDGIGYKLYEFTDRGVTDYYETRILKFRELT